MVRLLDKERELCLMEKLFDLMRENMPESVSQWEKENWLAEVIPALKKAPRQIALLYCKGVLAGFCMYYINSEKLMVEELQIRKEYRQTILAVELYRFLKEILPKDTLYVEAYADKDNRISRNLMEKHGMRPVGVTPDGSCIHYKGKIDCIFR